MKYLLVVILATTAGAFTTINTMDDTANRCKTAFSGPFLASFTDYCQPLKDAMYLFEFPLIDLTTTIGQITGKFVAGEILACAGYYVEAAKFGKLTEENITETFNLVLDSNAKKAWKKDLAKWLTANADTVASLNREITKTTYMIQNPTKAKTTTMSALKDKCKIIVNRMDDGTFDFTKAGNDWKQTEKLRKIAEKINGNQLGGSAPVSVNSFQSMSFAPGSFSDNTAKGAPGSPVGRNGVGAPGSMIGGGGGAPGSIYG